MKQFIDSTNIAVYQGPTVFRGKFCQIPWADSRNSAAHRGKIVQIPRLAMASHLWANWAVYCSETSVTEGWHCAKLWHSHTKRKSVFFSKVQWNS